MKDCCVSHSFCRFLNSGCIVLGFSPCKGIVEKCRAEASKRLLVLGRCLFDALPFEGGDSSSLLRGWSLGGCFISMILSICLLFRLRNSRFYSSFCSIWRLLCFKDSMNPSSSTLSTCDRSRLGVKRFWACCLSISRTFSFWEAVYMKSYLWRKGSVQKESSPGRLGDLRTFPDFLGSVGSCTSSALMVYLVD